MANTVLAEASNAFRFRNDPDESARIIHKALDAGINLVDCADRYGDAEEVVGKAITGRREDVVLATKVGMPMGEDPNQQGGSRRWITTAVENSLRLIGTDYLDIYQLRRPDPATDLKRSRFFRHLTDERRLDVVEQLVPLADEAGLPMTHLAMVATIAHPGVTSALLGARTMEHLDDLLAGVDVVLSDDVRDGIDEMVTSEGWSG